MSYFLENLQQEGWNKIFLNKQKLRGLLPADYGNFKGCTSGGNDLEKLNAGKNEEQEKR